MSKKRSRRRQPQIINPNVKQLRQLRSRRARDESGTFYIEGNRIVAQALQSPYQVEMGVIAPGLLSGEYAQRTAQALRETGAPVTELSRADFGAISFKENLQGIGAVVRARLETLDAVQPNQGWGWVALDNVGNSGNLGAILRTCDAVGCEGIILLGHTTDSLPPRRGAGQYGGPSSLSDWCGPPLMTLWPGRRRTAIRLSVRPVRRPKAIERLAIQAPASCLWAASGWA